MSLSDAVDAVEWHCSRRVCKHQYIVKREQPDLFKRLNDALVASPFTEKYLKCTYKVAFIAGSLKVECPIVTFKYWRMANVINRKPMTEEEFGKVARKETFLGEVKLEEDLE